MLVRFLPALLLLPLLQIAAGCPTAAADEKAEARAERVAAVLKELRSSDPASVARAAFEAGGLYRSKEALLPTLVTAASRLPWTTARHGRRVVKHLFDALIRLDGTLPMEVLERYDASPYTSTEVLILAARSGEAAHPLLRRVLSRALRDGKTDAAGIAAGNLLATAGDAQLAPLVLPHVRPRVYLSVRDQDDWEGRSIGIGAGTACARCTTPEGFPRAVWYTLSLSGLAWQRSLVAKGPVNSVWYRRHEAKSRAYFGCTQDRNLDATAIGLGWIATLLGTTPEQLPVTSRYFRAHRWESREGFVAYVAGVRGEVRRAIDALLDTMVRGKLLASGQRREARIAVHFEVEDRRHDRRVPLPKVEAPAGR